MGNGNGEQETIFVFGSNRAGIHGRGSALEARKKHGAIYGRGVGIQGHSYAIPTKDFPDERGYMKVLPLSMIQEYVTEFLKYARERHSAKFHVVAIGCGLAGFKDHQIAPLFAGASDNVELPRGWRELIAKAARHPDVGQAAGVAGAGVQ